MTVAVRRTPIIGTRLVVFSAWEPTDTTKPNEGGHMTVTANPEGSGYLGRIGSSFLPRVIEALPYGDERTAAVDAFRFADRERAYNAIVAAHPEAKLGKRAGGHIEIVVA